MGKRANYTNLNKVFMDNKNKECFTLSRKQLMNITNGYISSDVSYLKRKNAPLSKVANENGFYIDVVVDINVTFRRMN